MAGPPTADPTPAHPLIRLSGWCRLGLLREISGPARDVLLILATYASKERAQAFPAASTIIGLTGRSRSVVFAALKELQAGEVIANTGRVKRRGSEAWGPTIYGIARPPSPEKFEVLVRRLRTHRFPGGVPSRRTSRSTRDASGRFRCPSPRDGGPPSARDGGITVATDTPRPSATDTDLVPEVENLKGRREGEGVRGEGEQAREAPLRSALTGSALPPAPEEEADREEEQRIRHLQGHLEQYPAAKRQAVAQHLVLKGYDVNVVEAAQLRAGNGNG